MTMKAWFAAIALLLAAPAFAAAQPEDIRAQGTVPHAAARAGFPERVGEFQRVRVLRYGEDDISANYDLRRGENFLRVSVYIYPAQPAPRAQRAAACEQHMTGVTDVIMRQYPGAEMTENGAAPALPGTEDGLRFRAVHHIRLALRTSEPEDMRSESRLYCYVDDDWLVKYRISSNIDFDVDALIEDFIRVGPWPGRGAGSIALR
jgi:hypothetical protein